MNLESCICSSSLPMQKWIWYQHASLEFTEGHLMYENHWLALGYTGFNYVNIGIATAVQPYGCNIMQVLATNIY